MCGIVASIGSEASSETVAALKRLEYRGYDSFGFAWTATDGTLQRMKSLSPLDEFVEPLPESDAVLGHTRWATHGAVNLANCHPHAGDGFYVAHNGIVENHEALRSNLTKEWSTETDTEVIAELLNRNLRNMARPDAVRQTCNQLTGRNTIAVLFEDGELIAVRNGSPLILGKASHGTFLASDVLCVAPFVNSCQPLHDGDMVQMNGAGVRRWNSSGGEDSINWQPLEIDATEASRDGHPHYMLKEIMEQWQSVADQASVVDFSQLQDLTHRIVVTGSGGAAIAANQIAWLLRDIAGAAAISVPAYEFDTARPLIGPGDLVLAVSQSGETADTLAAVEAAADCGARTAALVNMPESTITREAHHVFYNKAGPEHCVLSTKSATAQVTFGYLLAHHLAGSDDDLAPAITELARYLTPQRSADIRSVARQLQDSDSLYLLGAGAFHAVAHMAALNIKEASYIHAEAFAVGELKHGVIALIEEGTPVLLYAPDNSVLHAASEVRSRGARVIGIGREDSSHFDAFIELPSLPQYDAISALIPGQLLAYHLGVLRGINPDRPRNLAKSVTVR